MLKIVAFVLLSEILTAFGQVLFKKSTNLLAQYSLKVPGTYLRLFKQVLSNPHIWLGLLSMAFGLAAWFIALAEGDLSLVFPIGSVQYIMILFLAHNLLDEKIDLMKVIGTCSIILGIILITMS